MFLSGICDIGSRGYSNVAHPVKCIPFLPEVVKDAIAIRNVSDSRKEIPVTFYRRYAEWKKLDFHAPRFRRVEKLRFIPLESENDQLIGVFGKRTATFLMLLRDTGARAGEAWNLKWQDIDVNNKTVTIKPEKRSRPRRLGISSQTLAMLLSIPKKSEYPFGGDKFNTFAARFFVRRKRVAENLQNSCLRRIGFKTPRHFKATIEYHSTKHILHVMNLLGHRNIKNTLFIHTHSTLRTMSMFPK